MFQSPQGGFVLFVVEITAHAVHDMRQLPAGGQFAVKVRLSRLGFHGLMGIEEREDAVLRMADGIVEIMNDYHGIAQRHAVIIASTGDEQDFTGTEELFFEQVARHANMPPLTKDKYMLLQPVAVSVVPLLIEAEPEEASRWVFGADRTFLLLQSAHYCFLSCCRSITIIRIKLLLVGNERGRSGDCSPPESG